MKIFITGATGLIGRRLVLDRLLRGEQVTLVSRDAGRAERLFAAGANPNIHVVQGHVARPGPWQVHVGACDAVIHLAGAPIAGRRWNDAYKKELWNSRVNSTVAMVEAITQAEHPPGTFLCASAVGIYGSRGDQELDESTLIQPDSFITRLGAAWEEAAHHAASTATRVVNLRTGIVLDARGGALEKMRLPFRFFMGSWLGSGRQYLPWVHHADITGLIDLALRIPSISGPLNLVSPNPLKNKAFLKTLGRVLHRPCWLPAPTFALRLALGEFAHELVASQRVIPSRAQQFGYQFRFPEAEAALKDVLTPPVPNAPTGAPLPDAPPSPGALLDDDIDPPDSIDQPLPTVLIRPREPVRLLALGMDGALLGQSGVTSRELKRACAAAQQAGCVIVPASARPPRGIAPVAKALGILSPIIAYNGAVIWNPLAGEAQFHEPLNAELALQIAGAVRQVHPRALITFESLDTWFTDILPEPAPGESVPSLTAMLGEPTAVKPLHLCVDRPLSTLNIMGSVEEIALVFPVLRNEFWQTGRVALFQPAFGHLQVLHPRADKSTALQRIATRMHIAAAGVLAIGDGIEDAGMLSWAGRSVALAHAPVALRRLADGVMPGRTDLGVAHAIHRLILQPGQVNGSAPPASTEGPERL
jgi:uncharacterized protein (TIGR01777 family)